MQDGVETLFEFRQVCALVCCSHYRVRDHNLIALGLLGCQGKKWREKRGSVDNRNYGRRFYHTHHPIDEAGC